MYNFKPLISLNLLLLLLLNFVNCEQVKQQIYAYKKLLN
jgi:hypothetical protein